MRRAREKFCPKCGEDITDSYEPQDDSVGIVGGWVCDKCDEGFPDENDERGPIQGEDY
jgi:hypothetical protein